jgi:FKBP-type peptidyl-prolyl cis-trans isomerase FkpA
MKYLAILFFSVFLMASSCKKNKDEECTATQGTTVAPAAEEQVVTKYIQDSSIANAVEFENTGMYYVVTQQGNSKRAKDLCSIVTAKYSGKLTNGYVFDKTAEGATARFTIGGLIEGWKRILPTVGEGTKIKLLIPASLAYGVEGRVNQITGAIIIPPNAMLIFDIEVVAID